MDVSVVIPSWKDPYLQNTITSLISNSVLGDKLEVIAVLDGYWRETQLKNNDRLVVLHLGKNVGMRDAINAGVRAARGKFIMRTDEHCMFGYGYDKELRDTCKDNWIMTMTRHFLDPVKWQKLDMEPVNYEKLVIQNGKKFAGIRWRERDKENAHKKIDQTMAMQGSCWFMPKAWWEKSIGELDSKNYGPLYQDSHEMIFKTWKAGGKMVLNKNTWFAHKHRKFPRTHQHTQNDLKGWAYCLKEWGDYYENTVRKVWKI